MKNKILIVEDQVSLQELYEEILTQAGYNIRIADSYKKAISAIREEDFDLAIIDVRLVEDDRNNRDGLRVLNVLTKLSNKPETILATGYEGDVEDEEKKYAIGVLQKPIDKAELLRLVEFGTQKKESKEKRLESWEVKDLFRNIVAKMSREHLNIEDILQYILEMVSSLVNAPFANLSLVQGNDLLIVATTIGETGNRYLIEDCISGLTITQHQTVNAPDIREEPFKSLFKPDLRSDTRSELAVPAMIGLDVIAVLNFESPQIGAFNDIDTPLIEDIAASAAIAIENARLQQSLIDQARHVIQLSNISDELNAIIREGSDIVAQKIVEKMHEFFKCQKVAIYLIHEGNPSYYYLAAHKGLSTDYIEKSKKIDLSSPRAYVARTGLPLFIQDTENNDEISILTNSDFVKEMAKSEGYRSFLDHPLEVQKKTIGSFVAYYAKPQSFKENDEEVALTKMFADHAAIALENAIQYRELELAKKKEKMAAIGEISGDLVHRLNSPLIAVKYNVELVEERYEENLDQYLREKLQEIKRIVIDAIEKVKKMKEQARGDIINTIPVAIPDLMQRVISDISIPDQIKINNRLEKKNLPPVKANKQLAKVFDNLINNAIEAMPQGGEIIIDGKVISPFVEISFTDTGIGIPDGWEEEIFNVFSVFSSKPSRKEGQGLGLWFSKAYITACEGEFPLPEKGKDGRGAKFTIRLLIYPDKEERQ